MFLWVKRTGLGSPVVPDVKYKPHSSLGVNLILGASALAVFKISSITGHACREIGSEIDVFFNGGRFYFLNSFQEKILENNRFGFRDAQCRI